MALYDDILSSSRKLCREGGIGNISMRKIANECNVTATAIYKHFKNRDELISTMMSEAFGIFEAELNKALLYQTSSDRILHTAIGYMNFALDNVEYYSIIFMSTARDYGLQITAEGSAQKLAPSFMFLVERVKECIATKILPNNDPLALAAGLWANFHGLVSLQILDHFSPVIKTREQFADFYLESIKLSLNLK